MHCSSFRCVLSIIALLSALPSVFPVERNLHQRRVAVGRDGTLYLKSDDELSEKVHWKFSSGPPVHFSYPEKGGAIYVPEKEDDINAYVGDDGKLHLEGDCWDKLKLSLNMKEFVDRSPLFTVCGILTASRRETIFVVGAESGRIFERSPIDNHRIPSLSSIGELEHVTGTEVALWFPGVIDEPTYYIRRSDFDFSYESRKTSEVLWRLAFSEIKVLYGCRFVDRLSDDCDGRLPVDMHGSLALDDGGVGDDFAIDRVVRDNLSYVPYYARIAITIAIAIAVIFIVVFTRWFFHLRTPTPASTPIEDTRTPTEDAPKKKSKNKKRQNKTSMSANYSLDSNDIIGVGSNDTCVFGGVYDGMSVAVKRIPKSFSRRALREFNHLHNSHKGANIVRLYGKKEDDDYVYLFLERCTCNLDDFISRCSSGDDPDGLLKPLGTMKELELRDAEGYPSAILLGIMRNIISGLDYLHGKGIIHRDLKPQNILVLKEESIKAKICDMGISKLFAGATSTSKTSTGSGTKGWRAPEQLKNKKPAPAADMFSLGCLLFFCVSGGEHPFGTSDDDLVNIREGNKDLSSIVKIPEAWYLIYRLLHPNPQSRAVMEGLYNHPLFWSAGEKLSYLVDANDKFQASQVQVQSALEKRKQKILGVGVESWENLVHPAIIKDMTKRSTYDYTKVVDLLRFIRNVSAHFHQKHGTVKHILGKDRDKLYSYFSTRFPNLLMEVYEVVLQKFP